MLVMKKNVATKCETVLLDFKNAPYFRFKKSPFLIGQPPIKSFVITCITVKGSYFQDLAKYGMVIIGDTADPNSAICIHKQPNDYLS